MFKAFINYTKHYRYWLMRVTPYIMLMVFITAAITAAYQSETYLQDLVLNMGAMLVPSLLASFLITGI